MPKAHSGEAEAGDNLLEGRPGWGWGSTEVWPHPGPGSLDLTLERQHQPWGSICLVLGECGQRWERGGRAPGLCAGPLAAPGPHLMWVPTSLLHVPPGLAGQRSGAAVQQPGQ